MDNIMHSPMLRGMIINSDEPLWAWDVHTDTIFWSRGAIRLLNFEKPPRQMSEWYELLPPDASEELMQAREDALSGDGDSSLECDYLFQDKWIHEILIVMSRNDEGHATRVLGSLRVMQIEQGTLGFYQNSGQLSDVGAWVFHVPTGKIWRDKACRAILGHEDNGGSIVSSEVPLLDVHPFERIALERHYRLFCESGKLGDHITDIVRVRTPNGEYEPILVRASAVERDANERAVLVAGIIAANDSSQQRLESSVEDNVFHAFQSMGNGQWTWDSQSQSINVGDRFLEMLGHNVAGVSNPAEFWKERIHQDDLGKVCNSRQAVLSTCENGDTYECTYRIHRADGEWAWIFERGCVVWRDQEGRAGNMLGSITNITTAQVEREKLEALVRTDPMTGVHSRGYFNLRVEQLENSGIRPVSAISIDVNGLKMINDSLGHAAGDNLLQEAAHILKDTLRSTDFIARTGGDEFVVLLSGYPLETAKKVLAKIENAFSAWQKAGAGLPVYAASGVACAETMEESLTGALARADEAMYINKKEARASTHKKIAAWIKDRTGKDPVKDDRLAED